MSFDGHPEHRCGWCGKPDADGLAEIDGIRYCHEDSAEPTCYQRETQRLISVKSAEEQLEQIEALRRKLMGIDMSASRPDWDHYFMGIAYAVADRADCRRAKHGAVVVKDKRIRATGYNAAASGGPSCLKGECPRGLSDVPSGSSYDSGPGTCVSLHAEQNALLFASRDDCEGGTLYITGKPCAGCWRMIQGSGIQAVVYPVPGQTDVFHYLVILRYDQLP